MNRFRSGPIWKYLSFWRRRLIPDGSRRAHLFGWVFRIIDTVANDGLLGFIWKFRNYSGNKKLSYKNWIKRNENWNKKGVNKDIESFSYTPLISIIVPVYNTDPKWLDKCILSVQSQIYKNWELCLYDDASNNKQTIECLEKWQSENKKIRIKFGQQNIHIAEASNRAIEMAMGEFIALLDHDDELSPYALYFVARALNEQPNLNLIYSDEDKIDEYGDRYAPYFKPDWNPDLLLSQNYINHFSVYRSELVNKLGCFRKGLEGAQDWDLALRAIEVIPTTSILHLPFVLYHWRAIGGSTALSGDQKEYIRQAQKKCLGDHFSRMGQQVEVIQLQDYWRVKYSIPHPNPLISIIIPTRNGFELLHRCIESIYQKTTYRNFEIIIIDNDSDDEKTIDYFSTLQSEGRANIIRYTGNFNFSAINNFAVTQSKGELVCLLNNDVEVRAEEWLSEMVSHALRPEIGAVGAKLLYPNGTIQHAGTILGIGGVAGHWFKHRSDDDSFPEQFNRPKLVQNLSAVTGACLLIRRSVYEKVGGLNEKNLPIAFNDIDFCIRIREEGYFNLYTPFAVLYHHESASRGYEDTPEKIARFSREISFMKQHWGDILVNDPSYNPNLTLENENAGLAFQTRIKAFR